MPDVPPAAASPARTRFRASPASTTLTSRSSSPDFKAQAAHQRRRQHDERRARRCPTTTSRTSRSTSRTSTDHGAAINQCGSRPARRRARAGRSIRAKAATGDHRRARPARGGSPRSGAVDAERSVERHRFAQRTSSRTVAADAATGIFEATAADRGPSTPHGRGVSLSPRARWSRAGAHFRTPMEENVSVSLALTVNGKPVSAEIDARTLLVDFLRNKLALTGTHVGCDTAQCGACTVHLDGQAVKACNVLAAAGAMARDVIDDRRPRRRRRHAASDAGGVSRSATALQCGFCTPGMVMSAIDLVNAASERRRGDDPRRARRQHLPLHRLSQHRQGRARRAPPRWASEETTMGANDSTGIASAIGQPVLRKEDARFLTGHGPVHRRRDDAAADARAISCARRMRTRRSARST